MRHWSGTDRRLCSAVLLTVVWFFAGCLVCTGTAWHSLWGSLRSELETQALTYMCHQQLFASQQKKKRGKQHRSPCESLHRRKPRTISYLESGFWKESSCFWTRKLPVCYFLLCPGKRHVGYIFCEQSGEMLLISSSIRCRKSITWPQRMSKKFWKY